LQQRFPLLHCHYHRKKQIPYDERKH
jgi:hypothetical protein